MHEQNTKLWQTAFGGDARIEARKLEVAYLTVRERAGLLAARIATDLPDFTVHDVSHIEGVWALADELAPRGGLNPAEVFVLGVAILIHDLGLALAAYPAGVDALDGGQAWRDEVAFAFRSAYDRAPSDFELEHLDPDIVTAATRSFLRRRHADRAQDLARVSWEGPDGPIHLVDTPWRDDLGDMIGAVAASHGWPVASLPSRFGAPQGASSALPREWTVDGLVLASLLRTADAAHLDSTRATAFARAVQSPSADSARYWQFQNRIAQPRIEDANLVFSSSSAFPAAEADAWWLAYESLRTVDRELRDTSELLRDSGRENLAATHVAGIRDPRTLARYVRVDGWTPVAAELHVSDVARLVDRLGGRWLYGDNPMAALREMLQNALDAVRARRAIEGRRDDWGDVTVALDPLPDGRFRLSVSDIGVGMAEAVMTGDLLDFGSSFWRSDRVLDELPGLVATAFRSSGRFGIGFFAIFMLGDELQVASRSMRAGPADTRVLEFTSGLASRPLMRPAAPPERLTDPGTVVSVVLDGEPLIAGALFNRGERLRLPLARLVAGIAPAVDVSLKVRDVNQADTTVVRAGDWRDLRGDQLTERIARGRRPGYEDLDEDVPEWDLVDAHEIRRFRSHAQREHMRGLVDDDGTVIGRMALTGMRDHSAGGGGVVVVDGLVAEDLDDQVDGVMFGTPSRASRDQATPVVSPAALAAWATEQATLVANLKAPSRIRHECARYVAGCHGDLGELPIAFYRDRWWSQDQFSKTTLPDSLLVTDFFAVGEATSSVAHWRDDVIVTGIMRSSVFRSRDEDFRGYLSDEEDALSGFGFIEEGALAAIVLRLIASNWAVSLEEVVSAANEGEDVDVWNHTVGEDADGALIRVVEAFSLRRPEARCS